MSAKRGTRSHADADVVVQCYNCKSPSVPGVKFCDACLTGMCERKLSVYKMFKELRRGKVVWDMEQ